MSNDVRQQLNELLFLQTDGKLDEASMQRICMLLRDNPDAQKLYVEHCQMETMLAWDHGAVPNAVVGGDSTSDATSVLVVFTRARILLLTLAASVLVATSLSIALWSRKSQIVTSVAPFPSDWESREIVATLTRRQGAQFSIAGTKVKLAAGAVIRTGHYVVTDGFVQLDFASGVEIIVESPASFAVSGPMRMQLARGKVSVKVSDQDKGFTVETPSADVVDFGTEFAVEVNEDQSSEVHVFMGEVEVRPKSPNTSMPTTADQDSAVRLVSNQATRFNAAASLPQGIDVALDRFVRDLDEPAQKYSRAVRALKPVAFLRMASSPDGESLDNKGSDSISGRIYRSEMKRPSFAPGRIGSALRLDGPDSRAYAVVPYQLAVKNQLTLSTWVHAESRPAWASIAKNWIAESSGQFHLGLFGNDGDLEVRIHDSEGNEVQVREHIPLPLNKWHHVTFVVDRDSLTLYRNAVHVASAVCRGLGTIAPKVLGIGVKLNDEGTAPATSGPGFWHGRIDELAIFHSSLSHDQVRDLYNSIRTSDSDKSK